MKTSERKYGRCMYFVSNAFARKMERLASDSWAPFDLSPSHAYLLMLVVEQPGIQPTAISEELQLSPSTITRLLEKLEEKKLLQRRMAGKITNIFPTAKAKKTISRIPAMCHSIFQRI